VADGLTFDSYAAQCAEMFGLPVRLVERAQYVKWVTSGLLCDEHILTPSTRTSQLLSRHELSQLLDEEMTEKEHQELEEAEVVCRRFLAWDLKADEESLADGEVKRKLAAVLGRGAEADE